MLSVLHPVSWLKLLMSRFTEAPSTMAEMLGAGEFQKVRLCAGRRMIGNTVEKGSDVACLFIVNKRKRLATRPLRYLPFPN